MIRSMMLLAVAIWANVMVFGSLLRHYRLQTGGHPDWLVTLVLFLMLLQIAVAVKFACRKKQVTTGETE